MSDERVALRAVGEDSLLARLEGPAGLKLLSSADRKSTRLNSSH